MHLNLFFLHVVVGAIGVASSNSDWKQQCPAAYEHHAPECLNNSTLYVNRGPKAVKESSCAHCDCLDGWDGLRCNLCKDVQVCPLKSINGSLVQATNCTNLQLLPTTEEALGEGKFISCTCGGGEDDWSALLCAQQPDTRLDFTIHGFGNYTHLASIDVIEYAAIRRMKDEAWPGQYDYWYPAVFNGSLSECTINTGKCLDIPNTTLSQRDCFVFYCGQTEIDCPPPGYAQCPGFPDCKAPNGEKYKTHKCDAIPQNNKVMIITCEVNPRPNGKFICYYQQPGGFAPLSVTCTVGSCIYEGGIPIDPDDSKDVSSSMTIVQQAGLLSGIIFLICISFTFFGFITLDKATTARCHISTKCHRNTSEGSASDDEFFIPFLLEETDLQRYSEETVLEWFDISYYIYSKGAQHAILQGVSGRTEKKSHIDVENMSKSNILGVLGPSGSGKSTLLELLSGRKFYGHERGCWSGTIELNQSPVTHEKMRSISGFVSQSDDVLPETLTVYEHLLFHAKFRLPSSFSHLEQCKRVIDIIDELKLTSIADNLIGGSFRRGISGGEKRRVSVATELLSRPKILFLDEPTSGLDATSALMVMRMIEKAAHYGTTIICTLHQPRKEVFDMLGRVVVLIAGKVAYDGMQNGIFDYFSYIGRPISALCKNPADGLLDICLINGDELPRLFRQYMENSFQSFSARSKVLGIPWTKNPRSTDQIEDYTEMKTQRRYYSFHHFILLSSRLMRQAHRHPLLLALHGGGAIAMALILGLVFRGHLEYNLAGAQSRFGLLFFELLFMALLSLSSLPVWRENRRLFLAERDMCAPGGKGLYSTGIYFTAVALFDILLIRVVPPLIVSLISYPIVGLNQDEGHGPRLLIFSLTLVLADVAMALAVMGIGVAALPLPLGNLLGAVEILVFVMFSRFLLNVSNLPFASRWVTYVTPIGYAYEALLINEFGEGSSGGTPYRIEGTHCAPDLPLLEPLGPEILKAFGFQDSIMIMSSNIVALGALSCAYAIISLFILVRAARRNPLPLYIPSTSNGGCFHRVLTSGQMPQDQAAQYTQPTSVQVKGQKNGPVSSGPILSWAGLTYSIKIQGDRKIILDRVSGNAGGNAGVVGLMGASGAGKTTLLELLAGRKDNLVMSSEQGRPSGTILVNGTPASTADIRSISGYVTQDDVLPGMLTVFEHLCFHAQLRLSRTLTSQGRSEKVLEIIDELGLNSVADSIIGDDYRRGLSGGERRRVSIASEMISYPCLLFLDEPTTGLDASNALAVMELISACSKRGTTVMCSLHQPRQEVFEMLGRVVLLKQGGLAYFGPPQAAYAHFASIGHPLSLTCPNPADAILDATALLDTLAMIPDPSLSYPAYVSSQIEQFQMVCLSAMELANEREKVFQHRYWAFQTYVLLKRAFIVQWRDPRLILLHTVLPMFAGIAVGWAFEGLKGRNEDTSGVQDRFGLFFFILLFLALLGLASIPQWILGTRLYRQERSARLYGPSAHLISMAIPDLLFCRLIPTFMLLVTIFPIAGTRSGLNTFFIAFTTLGLFEALMSVFLGIIAIFSKGSAAAANAGGSLLILFGSLFGGLLVPADQLGWTWGWASYLSPFRWAFEALVSNEFGGIGPIFRLSTRIGTKVAKTELLTGNQILSCFGYDSDLLPLDLLLLLLMFSLGWLSLYLLLRRH